MSELTKPTLSNSSWKVLKSCEQKYFYNKVLGLEKDEDYEEGDAMGFGKAFHKVLEETLHTSYSDKLILAAMEEFGVDIFSRPLLTAMLDNYVKLHKASGLKVVKCEFKLEIPGLYLGFIDFIAQDKNGFWFGDLKTAGRHDPNLLPRLHKDTQINLYSRFAPEVAIALDLKGPFLGFRYRQAIKSKAGTPSGLAKGTPTYDIEIPSSILSPEDTWNDFLDGHNRATELFNGEAPKRNYGGCFEYFRFCEHFSKCHGCLSSIGEKRIVIHTVESLTDSELL